MWAYKYDFQHHTGLRSLREHTTSQKGKNRLVPLSSAVLTVLCLCSEQDRSDILRPGLFILCQCGSGLASVLIWNSILRKSKKKKKKLQEKREKTHKHWLWYTNKNNALVWVGEEHSVLFGSAQLSQESVDIFGVHVMQHAAGLPTWQKWKQKQSYFCSSLQELIFTQIYDKRMGDDLLSQSGKSFILQSHCLIRNWIGK